MPEDVDLGGLPILMPVRAFSWGSSFQRRLDLLRDTRPHIARELIIAHQDEIGSQTLASRLRRLCARPPSAAPLVRSQSMLPESLPSATLMPPTMRHPPPFWGDHPLVDQADSFWSERRPSSQPASSRPSGTRPTRPPISLPEDDWASMPREPASREPALSEPVLSKPVLSKPILREPIRSEPKLSEPMVSGARAKRGDGEEQERASMVLPKLPTATDGEPESARDRFRRAAEIGQQARKDASSRKKDR